MCSGRQPKMIWGKTFLSHSGGWQSFQRCGNLILTLFFWDQFQVLNFYDVKLRSVIKLNKSDTLAMLWRITAAGEMIGELNTVQIIERFHPQYIKSKSYQPNFHIILMLLLLDRDHHWSEFNQQHVSRNNLDALVQPCFHWYHLKVRAADHRSFDYIHFTVSMFLGEFISGAWK